MKGIATGAALAGVVLTLCGSADAHTLSKARARAVAEGIAEGVFRAPELRASRPYPSDYGAGDCRRRGAHAVRCTWVVEFRDGSYCGGLVLVWFSRESTRLRSRLLGGVMCSEA